MEWTDFHEFFRLIEEDNLSLFYRGNFGDEITIRLIDLSESHFRDGKEQLNLKKKVTFLMAECFQNVIRYGDVDNTYAELTNHSGFFMTRGFNNKFYIASGNLVEQKNALPLRAKIENINKHSKEELKELYMKVLGTDKFTSRGGAGLGLIEMARKSGRKIEAEFDMLNRDLAYFYLQINIDSPPAEEQNLKESRSLPIEQAIMLNHLLQKNNVIMGYQGDFRQITILPLLTMIEKNLAAQKTQYSSHKALYHVLVEVLQNIMHHGYAENEKREGVFTIGVRDHNFTICAANYVSCEKVTALKEILDHFLGMEPEELRDTYKSILKDGEGGPFNGSGLGIIDIIRVSSQKPSYVIVPVNDEKFLFYLNVRI